MMMILKFVLDKVNVKTVTENTDASYPELPKFMELKVMVELKEKKI